MAHICAAVCDLIFAAKIRGTADALGADLLVVRTADQLLVHLDDDTRVVIVDLNLESDDPIDLVRQVKARQLQARLICYVSHVDAELASAAAQAGADDVLPRSRFVRALPELVGSA